MHTYVTTISFTTRSDVRLDGDALLGTARAILNNPFTKDMRVTIDVASPAGSISEMNVILVGEDSRIAAELEDRRLAESAGWMQRDGLIFDAKNFVYLTEAQEHPDSIIYGSWTECVEGERLRAPPAPEPILAVAEMTAPEPSPGDVHEPVIPRLVPRMETATIVSYPGEDVPDGYEVKFHMTANGWYFKRPDGQNSTWFNSKESAIEAAKLDPIGGRGEEPDDGLIGGAPEEPVHSLTYTQIDGLKPGWETYNTKKGWAFRKPDGPDVGYFSEENLAIAYAFERAAWYGHVLDRTKARPGDTMLTGETPPTSVPTPNEAFTDAINKALDVLLNDVPDWRKKFHPLASSKGKRALEDLVGLVATIRAELKSENDKNVTN